MLSSPPACLSASPQALLSLLKMQIMHPPTAHNNREFFPTKKRLMIKSIFFPFVTSRLAICNFMEGILIFGELEHPETSSKQKQSEYFECIQSTIVWVQSTTCKMQIVNCQKMQSVTYNSIKMQHLKTQNAYCTTRV